MEIQTEKIGIYEVESLKESLLKELSSSNSINIDFSKVQKIELSAIQLFVALKKSCDEKGVKLTFSNIDEDVHQSIEMSGCDSFLGV
jgi:anti-anti-sigma factor